MPRAKMMPPLPETDESEHERFKRFAKAILSVPRNEIVSPEEALAKLQAQRQKIDAKIDEVRRALVKRKA